MLSTGAFCRELVLIIPALGYVVCLHVSFGTLASTQMISIWSEALMDLCSVNLNPLAFLFLFLLYANFFCFFLKLLI